MTDLGSSRPAAGPSPAAAHDPARQSSAWAGWVVFAGVMMVLLGCFQAIEGLVAVFDDGFYHVTQGGLVLDVDYTAWGWTHLLLGALIIICGVGVLNGNAAARAVGVLLAGLSALANLAFIAAYPIWSVLIIAIDVLVIYALIVHGRELRGSRM
jgi:hypothetical protein